MKSILALLVLLTTGCTPLLVEKPIGSNFPPEELSDFEGTWLMSNTDDDSQIIELKKIDNNGTFRTATIEWNDDEKVFGLNEGEIILKKGNEYGVLHLRNDDPQNKNKDFLLITLFQITEDKKIEYWFTEKKSAKEFLNSDALKTENVNGDIIITDSPQQIINKLESNHHLIFSKEFRSTLTKIK